MITDAQRKKIENKIYKVMDLLDETGTNTEHYKKMFADMNNTKFEALMKSDFPFRFHSVPFKVEPKMSNIINALNYLGIPLLEEISLPYIYKNEKGEACTTKECFVGYLHMKKVQQFATHKNSIPTSIKSRDMRTGLLTWDDKGGRETDREAECLLVSGLDNCAKELYTFRADYMDAKNEAYSTITNTGTLSMDDIKLKQSDSLSKNMLDVYIIGSLGKSNIITDSYKTKYTLEHEKQLSSK